MEICDQIEFLLKTLPILCAFRDTCMRILGRGVGRGASKCLELSRILCLKLN
jgi:hypothetical protein